MLKSFHISGFKIFDNVEIDRLSRLNLFVGTNNSGKSCLLEAIRLWSANASPATIKDLVRSHDGNWENIRARRRLRSDDLELDLDAESTDEDPIRFLFHAFHYDVRPFPSIQLGPADSGPAVRISLAEYQTIGSDDGLTRRVKVDTLFDAGLETTLMLEITIGEKRTITYPLNNFWSRPPLLRIAAHDDLPIHPVTVVGTSGLSPAVVAQLWDKVSLTPEQERVLDWLRLVENEIEGLALVADRDSYSNLGIARLPVVSVRGTREKFPLKTMGDGVTRLFHIALSMVNAQNGIVLIDEFENGLYWEVQKRLWPLVFDLAEDFNVQVFATSHSNDCLDGFVKAADSRPELGSLYRMERSDNTVRIRRLPLIVASDAIASQVEIR